MSRFEERYNPGREWEIELAAGLEDRGWKVCEFGQGQLTDAAHKALRNWSDSYGRPSLIRWLPDLLAWRAGEVYMIDAKTESERQKTSQNVSIELDAMQVGTHIETVLNTPMLFVWRDGAATPRTISNRWHTRRDGRNTNGSGTSFLLVAKEHLTPLSAVFGDRSQAA
jgi:hypothetical protein